MFKNRRYEPFKKQGAVLLVCLKDPCSRTCGVNRLKTWLKPGTVCEPGALQRLIEIGGMQRSVQMRDSFRFRRPRLFKPFLDGKQTFQQSEEDLSYLINNDTPLPLPNPNSSYNNKEDFKALVDVASPHVNGDPWVQAFAVYFANVIAKDVNWSKSSDVFDPSVEFVNSLNLPKIRWDKSQVYIDDNLLLSVIRA